ncbi:MAG TPA: ATP-binding protein [Bacteroidota bacterium]|nr:ATP-binding protein [Bacteroidota bacterium]
MKNLSLRTALYLLLDAFLLLASLVHIPDVVRRSSAPFSVDERKSAIVISAVRDSSACGTIQKGDTLLEWNGRKVLIPEMVEYLADVSPIGTTVTIGVKRGEKTVPSTVRLIRYYQPTEFIVLPRFLIISLFVGFALLGVGMFILLSRPGDPAARALHWALITFGTTTLITWGLAEPGSLEPAVSRVIWFIVYLGVAVSFFYFTLVFPRERFRWISKFWWVFLLAVCVLGLTFAWSHLTALWTQSADAFRLFQHLFDAFHVSLFVFIGGGLFNLARATVHASSDEERKKMYWILWGLTIGAVPFLLLQILPQVLFAEYLIPEEFTTILFLAVPVGFVIALLKYKLFDIEVLINRTIVYGVLSTAILAGYALTVLLLTSALGEAVFGQYLLIAALTLVIGLVVNPLRLRLQHIVDEVLFAARANYRRALAGAEGRLRKTLDRASLFRELVEATHEVVPGECIACYEKTGSQLILRSFCGVAPPPSVEVDRSLEDLIKISGTMNSSRAPDGGGSSLDSAREKFLSGQHWSACIPVTSQSGDLLAALVLNPRHGDSYKEEELMFLESLAAQASELLERLILQEEIILAQEERRRLEELNALKSFFVSSVSHELRTPLTSIVIFAEMLRSGRVRSSKQRKEYLGIIEGESNRLSRLITNILDFAKIERGVKEYNFSETDVREVVGRTVRAIRYQFVSRDAVLRVKIPKNLPTMMADADALEEALLNLLSNALKYSTTIKKVSLEVVSRKDAIVITVADKGIGIPEHELPHIFDQFYRVRDEKTRQVGGTGLGLAVVKHIVDAHHGSICATSVEGKGTTFAITLPLERPIKGTSHETTPDR